jgi:hypothetical protein
MQTIKYLAAITAVLHPFTTLPYERLISDVVYDVVETWEEVQVLGKLIIIFTFTLETFSASIQTTISSQLRWLPVSKYCLFVISYELENFILVHSPYTPLTLYILIILASRSCPQSRVNDKLWQRSIFLLSPYRS